MAPIPKQEYCPRIRDELRTGALWRDAFSELVATFFFVAANIFLLKGISDADPIPATLSLQVGIGVAFLWGGIGYGLGDFGGAHISSAVTMAMLVRAEVTLIRAIIYWIMQTAGSIGAAFFVYVITPEGQRGSLGNFVIADDLEWWQGMVIEVFVTTILCLTYLGSHNISRKGYVILQSIPIGMAAGLGCFLSLPSTRGCMSPTQAVGPAVVSSFMMDENKYWEQHWVFWAGPMIGAVFAAILYWVFDTADKESVSNMGYGTWSYANYGGAGRPGKSTSREALTQPSDGGFYPQSY